MCDYCEKGKTLGYDDAGDGIGIESDGDTAILGSDTWEIMIKYCPICGRELT